MSKRERRSPPADTGPGELERVLHIAHVVVTASFAGTERYVCDVARVTASCGHNVTVVGGDPLRVPALLGAQVRWLPGASVPEAVRSLFRVRPLDVVHAHLTAADAVGAAVCGLRGARLVSTRHIAAPRGRSHAGALVAPGLRRAVDRQLAISDFVARAADGASIVVRNGVADQPARGAADSRIVLVCQRLEKEKNTDLAMRAFARSDLPRQGWRLQVAGEGSQNNYLAGLAQELGIADATEMLGFVSDVATLMRRAAVLLATAPEEPLGLTVLEAMSHGVPVIAASGGGHLETIGCVPGAALFRPGDESACAAALERIAADPFAARAYGDRGRAVQQRDFELHDHVRRVLAEYRS